MNTAENSGKHTEEMLRGLLNGKDAFFPIRLCATYPQIAEKICSLWRDPTILNDYFTDLLTTQREKREGFPPDIHREIFTLSSYYSSLHPQAKLNDDFWNGLDAHY